MSPVELRGKVLDEIAMAAHLALVNDGVERSQVNKLIEVLESTHNVDYLLAHIARQVGRGIWGRSKSHYSASKLFSLLKGRNVEEARTILGMFKWLYEAGLPKSWNLTNLARELRLRPTANAIEGFFYRYLETVLR